MSEGIKVFFAGLAAFFIAVILEVVLYFIAGLVFYLLVPLVTDADLTYTQSVAIVTLLRLVGSLLFDNHTTKIKLKAVDNE